MSRFASRTDTLTETRSCRGSGSAGARTTSATPGGGARRRAEGAEDAAAEGTTDAGGRVDGNGGATDWLAADGAVGPFGETLDRAGRGGGGFDVAARTGGGGGGGALASMLPGPSVNA